jgi:hypothetical protein
MLSPTQFLLLRVSARQSSQLAKHQWRRDKPAAANPEATDPHKRGFLAYVWEIVGRTALG